MDTFTDTVALTDDFEPVRGGASGDSSTRNNSALHIRITSSLTEAATATSSPPPPAQSA